MDDIKPLSKHLLDRALATIDQMEARQQKLVEALKALKEDYADSEGCYCGQMIGGTDSEGLPLGKCGYCLASEAFREIGGQEKAG
jgi:hypothetical protein